MKTGLLLIDCQYDFADPRGALFVKGADKDMERLAIWIRSNWKTIDSIVMTLDSHQPNDISHPKFWQDASGFNPKPFTQITMADVESGKWKPVFEPEKVVNYLKQLETQGEYPHFIWPEHCLTGSLGASVVEPVMSVVTDWAKHRGKTYNVITKGEYQFSEHFGAFRAQVPVAERNDTQNNEWLMNFVREHDVLYVAGEARSHCVISTLSQLVELFPKTSNKIIVLDDCTSSVEGMEHIAKNKWEKVIGTGVKLSSTRESLRKTVLERATEGR